MLSLSDSIFFKPAVFLHVDMLIIRRILLVTWGLQKNSSWPEGTSLEEMGKYVQK